MSDKTRENLPEEEYEFVYGDEEEEPVTTSSL